MKIVFIGCVEIGFECLKQILEDGWDVSAIFTLAKRYAGQTSGFCDFSLVAQKKGIRLYRVRNIDDRLNVARMKRLRPDLIVVCGWQQLVGEEILRIPSRGTIGFHSSLLPRYRGRAPVNWALIRGEKETGVTMFYCDPEPDAGDIIAQSSFPILINDTCGTVYRKAARAVRRLLHEYGPRIVDETAPRIPNDSRNHRCWPKRRPEDGRIDWNRGALGTHNWIRALTHPYPGAFTYCQGKKYFIWGSKYKANGRIDRKASQGEILKIKRTNGKQWLKVAAGDRPLWVTEITEEDGLSKANLKVGNRLV